MLKATSSKSGFMIIKKKLIMKQKQFLNLTTAEDAEDIIWKRVQPKPVGEETVLLNDSLKRVLSQDVVSAVNVPFFDRSNFDGYAVKAENTFGAEETEPVSLKLNSEILACGVLPHQTVEDGTATVIATGGVIPRGANAVLMVENSLPAKAGIDVIRSLVPGEGVSFAGSDIGLDEIILHAGEKLTSRKTGTLAAIGQNEVKVWKKPRVGILSTGDEIISPGHPMEIGKVFDSNGVMIAHALEELGCEPVRLGIIPDDEQKLESALLNAIELDFIILSGGTSKGAGDLNYQVVEKMGNPGIIIHGVALKPGKPLCVAIVNGTPLVILPGFPTSALFTFSRFIAPVLRVMAGEQPEDDRSLKATLPIKINSDKGRTEFNLVNVVRGKEGYSAYSVGKGSGSITSFCNADGFIEIPRQTEILQAGTEVTVQLSTGSGKPADLIVIGSHCVGMDFLMSLLQKEGFLTKFIPVGSMGGVRAAKRGECDIAGSHLMDEKTGVYNSYLLNEEQRLVKGYRRNQGILYRTDDNRFKNISVDFAQTMKSTLADDSMRMINRNRGSGTRVLLDQIVGSHRPAGYLNDAKSHNAVAATIAQNRADWGMAIRSVAENLDLGFYPYQDEEYDFVIPNDSLEKPAVKVFLEIIKYPSTIRALDRMGLKIK